MNKVIVTGNITKDADLTQFKEYLIAKYTIAVQRTQKNKNGEYESDFLNCVQFNPSDYIKDKLVKGNKLLIEGRIQTNVYEKDNKKHYSTDILVERVEVLKHTTNTQEPNPFKEFGQQFEIKEQEQIEESEYPF